jgi:hypothetical protein
MDNVWFCKVLLLFEIKTTLWTSEKPRLEILSMTQMTLAARGECCICGDGQGKAF